MSTKERRYDEIGEFRLMGTADGYVMCRRPGCMPRVMPVKDWERLSLTPLETEPPTEGDQA